MVGKGQDVVFTLNTILEYFDDRNTDSIKIRKPTVGEIGEVSAISEANRKRCRDKTCYIHCPRQLAPLTA